MKALTQNWTFFCIVVIKKISCYMFNIKKSRYWNYLKYQKFEWIKQKLLKLECTFIYLLLFREMLNQKLCIYHSNKNCFIYLDSSLKSSRLNEKVYISTKKYYNLSMLKLLFYFKSVVELVHERETKPAFFSIVFIDSSQANREKFYLNSFYAKKLKINEKDLVNWNSTHNWNKNSLKHALNKYLQVLFNAIHQECPIASSITIEPVSVDDWEILVNLNVHLKKALYL